MTNKINYQALMTAVSRNKTCYVISRAADSTDPRIVMADNIVIDRNEWLIDFIAFPTADFYKLREWGLID